MAVSMSALKGIGRCNKRRAGHLNGAKKSVNTTFEREKLLTRAIIGVLGGTMTMDEARASLKGAYADDPYPELMKAQKEKDLWAYLQRYLNSEKRIPKETPPAVMNIWGVDVNVCPDFYFWDGQTLEIVKIRMKKPDLTQSGRKLDSSADGSLDLYSLMYYGKTMLPDSPSAKVKASYYYLIRQDDSLDNDRFDPDFTGMGARNVISITDEARLGTVMDTHYRKLYADFAKGEDREFSKTDCRNCEMYGICANRPLPVPMDKSPLSVPISAVRLTKSQQEAISFEKGVARINAGAGTGKTLVVALRVVSLLQKGARPEEIVLLTFSNNGAMEMTERVQNYCAQLDMPSPDGLISMTFNSLGDQLIENDWREFGFTSKPILVDDAERLAMIERIVEAHPIDGLNYRSFRANERNVKGGLTIVSRVFEIFKDYGLGKDDALSSDDLKLVIEKLGADSRHVTEFMLQQLVPLYHEFEDEKRAENYIEYADQEWLLLKLPDRFFRNTGIKHIIVDEFQDSSTRQMEIIKKLSTSVNFESLMVVGDDSQAIYGFRDTSPYNILHFFELMGVRGEDFYELDNFRSTPEIIRLANGLNRMNKTRIDKDLKSTRPSGKKPFIQAYMTAEEETDAIVSGISSALASGRAPEEIAFIAETKAELQHMKDRLDALHIPSSMIVPEPVWDNPLVQGAKGLFDLMEDPENEIAAAAYLTALGDGQFMSDPNADAYVKQWTVWAVQANVLPSDQKRDLYFELLGNFVERGDEIFDKFYESVSHKPGWSGICSYFHNASLYGGDEEQKRDLDYPGVTLTTAHSSKGLEWPVCFVSVTRFDNELLRAPSRSAELEERRRLLFVAITRARDELYVTGKYYSFGDKSRPALNIFMDNLYTLQGRNLAAEFDYEKRQRAGT